MPKKPDPAYANTVKGPVLSHFKGFGATNATPVAPCPVKAFKKAANVEANTFATAKRPGRGWHATTGRPPRQGPGTATVGPFRSLKDIAAIKGTLANHPRDFALFVVGIHVGLRGGDLLALRWSDVMAPDGTITNKIEVTETKTKKRRAIVLQKNAQDALGRWLSYATPNPGDYIFAGPNSQPLTIQRLHQLVNIWAARAEIHGHYGSHSLRKTYGYQLRRLGVSLETLMKIFGHSSESVTLRYIGVDQDTIDEAGLKLNL